MKTPNEQIIDRFGSSGEDWHQIVNRVSSVGCGPDRSVYAELISNGTLAPGGQILRGVGYPTKLLYNCFVTSQEESEPIEHVADRVTHWTAQGVGVGLNLDYEAAQARAIGGSVCTAILSIGRSQQRLWNRGVTRTATMVTLSFEDPEAVVAAKTLTASPETRHLNLAILVSDKQMKEALACVTSAAAHQLRKLCNEVWASGNPGFLFVDRINRDNPFETPIVACNPCAEQFLDDSEGCNLASLNLASFVKNGQLLWIEFDQAVTTAVRLLDDVVDATSFPSRRAEALAKSRRRIGLGVMGFATALSQLNIAYGSQESIALAQEWASRMRTVANAASTDLATMRGATEPGSTRRNSHLISIAPTGAISLLWSVSSGIEPYFAQQIVRGKVASDYRQNLLREPELAEQVPWENHVAVLAAWQTFVDGGISKTINMSQDSTPSDIREAVVSAWRNQCKGVSIFRTGSRTPAMQSVLG